MYFGEEEVEFLKILGLSTLESEDITYTESIPTHTEDGIPIMKLFVSNLPPKTTRQELFNLFASYGHVKTCWVKSSEKEYEGPKSARYAFVTFTHAEDAHRALVESSERGGGGCMLRGRMLHVRPADSWHQPYQRLRPRPLRSTNSPRQDLQNENDAGPSGEAGAEESESGASQEPPADMMATLNQDCVRAVLQYLSLRDMVRLQAVNTRWRDAIATYLHELSALSTERVGGRVTTAVLREVVKRSGGALRSLRLSGVAHRLNDRAPHVVAAHCPGLRTLHVLACSASNWRPVWYACRHLTHVMLDSCSSIRDASLSGLCWRLTALTICNNSHITGEFLSRRLPKHAAPPPAELASPTAEHASPTAENASPTAENASPTAENASPTAEVASPTPEPAPADSERRKRSEAKPADYAPTITTLTFVQCYSLQGSALIRAGTSGALGTLRSLRLEACGESAWRALPALAALVPGLHSLAVPQATDGGDALAASVPHLPRLTQLVAARNLTLSDASLETIAAHCKLLTHVDLSGCNSREPAPNAPPPMPEVSSSGVCALAGACGALASLDVSYCGGVEAAPLARALARCAPHLAALTMRALPAPHATHLHLAPLLQHCKRLVTIDVSGCEGVEGEALAQMAQAARAEDGPHGPLRLCIGGTTLPEEHKLEEAGAYGPGVRIDLIDHSSLHLRLDFVDALMGDGSDDEDDDDDDLVYFDYDDDDVDDDDGAFFEYDGAYFDYDYDMFEMGRGGFDPNEVLDDDFDDLYPFML